MNLEAGRIFFLGAGFSAGANIPLMNKLLTASLNIFNEEASGLYERLSWHAQDLDLDLNSEVCASDFVQLCTYLDFMELREHGGGERWSREGSRERVALKYFLAKAVALSTPENNDIPTQYLSFASRLKAEDLVVTFNWDLLLEKSLDAVKKQYSYTGEIGKIQILKLHGSVNWVEGLPRSLITDRPTFDYRPLGLQDEMNGIEIYSSENLKNIAQWRKSRCLIDEVKPLLVLPGYGKAYDVRLLSCFWYRPEFFSLRNGGISIIGFSVGKDDYFIESMFRYLFRSAFSDKHKVRVLNPDPALEEIFSNLSDKSNQIQFLCDYFDDRTLDYIMHA